ncbi:hypothetical protein [Actinoplanes utahensis]|uniref:hypothetical protein n=1 Tax=Actinoplanes utahensis TaxID=1869 RepID=UPI001269C82E|nr:hypothetical protein [Actinoplanes utahensis]GIF29146.1 hypothetical protein Aut01nite_21320 [Actinoplanes utahensis]
MAVANDSGGAYLGTGRFASSDIEQMWNLVRDHDHVPHQAALEGWRHAYELILMHRTQIETYKDKLIQAWPPERSSASRAYVARLDVLIENLTSTYEASIANYTTYSSAINAVSAAKAEIKTIRDEYLKNAALIAEYQEAKSSTSQPLAEAGMIPGPEPVNPVPDWKQKMLQQQAAEVMTKASAELSAAKFALVSPAPFQQALENVYANSGSIGGGGGGVGGGSVASASSGSSGHSARLRPADSIIPAPVETSRPSTEANPLPTGGGFTGQPNSPDSGSPSDGPVLGGAKPDPTGPVNTLPTNTNPITTTPNTGPNLNNTGPYTITPGVPPTSTLPRSGFGPHSPTTGRGPGTPPGVGPGIIGGRGNPAPHPGVLGAVPPGGTSASGRGGMPVGGMPVGGAPSASRAGQAGSPNRAGQRINPVGGMIGQDGMVRPGQRQTRRSGEEEQSRTWDPDNPWETDAGIDPVLLPQPERRIDPGPTIGGR